MLHQKSYKFYATVRSYQFETSVNIRKTSANWIKWLIRWQQSKERPWVITQPFCLSYLTSRNNCLSSFSRATYVCGTKVGISDYSMRYTVQTHCKERIFFVLISEVECCTMADCFAASWLAVAPRGFSPQSSHFITIDDNIKSRNTFFRF